MDRSSFPPLFVGALLGSLAACQPQALATSASSTPSPTTKQTVGQQIMADVPENVSRALERHLLQKAPGSSYHIVSVTPMV